MLVPRKPETQAEEAAYQDAQKQFKENPWAWGNPNPKRVTHTLEESYRLKKENAGLKKSGKRAGKKLAAPKAEEQPEPQATEQPE